MALAMFAGFDHLTAGTVSLSWNPSADPNVVGYDVYYGTASQVYTTNIDVGQVTNTLINGLADGTTYYFAAVSYDAAGDESIFSNETPYTTTYPATYPPPTLDPTADLTINENDGGQYLDLTGIFGGDTNADQALTVTAVSSNPALIPTPTVAYTSPNATGTLTFAPAPNAFGSATITVTVNNGGASNNIVTQSFTVTVSAVNQPPTLDAMANLSINENAGGQNLALTGIASGNAGQNQVLTVTAVSSNPALIPTPTVAYTSPNATGTLTFAPAPNAFGSATITVTVNNGGASNHIVTQSFTVTVSAVNQPPTLGAMANLSINENAGGQNLALTGIASGNAGQNQVLTVTAVSSNPALIPTPTVAYASPNATGTLTFAPVPNAFGSATITVTVNNGGASNHIVTQSFTVTVSAVNQPPTLGAMANLSIKENAGKQTVDLTGIASGNAGQNQVLTVTAVSSNPALIPTPTVAYTSPNATGTLTFAPAPNAFGSATITVTVNNGGASSHIVTQSFTVTVNAVNQFPTLGAIANLSIKENAGKQTIDLTGFASGNAGQNQVLTVTAVSSNPALIPTPAVAYTSPNATGTLTFAPAPNAFGSATITVIVNNGGARNHIVTQSFTVTVNAVSQPPALGAIANLTIKENAGKQTVDLTGITPGAKKPNQKLKVTAVSSNPALIPTPAVAYTSPRATGTLIFTPVRGASGSAIITVTVNNGGANNNTATQSFTVAVLPPAQPVVAARVAFTKVAGNKTATLTPQVSAVRGQFGFTVSGDSGNQYVVEASTDLIHWTPVQTNTSPFTLVDTNAGALPQRFYRAEVAP